MYRFARREKQFLYDLRDDAISLLGDHNDVVNHARGSLPHDGSIAEPPALNSLIDALELKGDHGVYAQAAQDSPMHQWFARGPTLHDTSPPLASVQSKVYKVFSKVEKVRDLSHEMTQKIVTTLGNDLAGNIVVQADWFQRLLPALKECKPHSRMCLFKTFIGGWTTTYRMHEPTKFKCIFGCTDMLDDIRHYITCAPLWHIVGEVLEETPPLALSDRLCLTNCSPFAIMRIALAFQCYHYTKSLCVGDSPQVCVQDTRELQKAALESGLAFFRHLN
jgi:hypothetical protein